MTGFYKLVKKLFLSSDEVKRFSSPVFSDRDPCGIYVFYLYLRMKTRRMAIANGTCVSFCNQPNAHYLVTSRESRQRMQAFGYVKRVLRHIFASLGYAPGTTAVYVTRMEREFNACQKHRSMYPSIFNRFPVIQPVRSQFRHFSIFLHILASPWLRPWDNRGKCCMDRKRIHCLSNASHLQPFSSNSTCVSWKVRHFSTFLHILASPGYALGTTAVNVTRLERGFNACKMPRCIYTHLSSTISEIAIYRWRVLIENCDIFIPHLCLVAPQGVIPLRNFAKILIYTKLEWMGYRVAKKVWQYVQPFWYNTSVWRTDRQTDRQIELV